MVVGNAVRLVPCTSTKRTNRRYWTAFSHGVFATWTVESHHLPPVPEFPFVPASIVCPPPGLENTNGLAKPDAHIKLDYNDSVFNLCKSDISIRPVGSSSPVTGGLSLPSLGLHTLGDDANNTSPANVATYNDSGLSIGDVKAMQRNAVGPIGPNAAELYDSALKLDGIAMQRSTAGPTGPCAAE